MEPGPANPPEPDTLEALRLRCEQAGARMIIFPRDRVELLPPAPDSPPSLRQRRTVKITISL